MFSIDWQLCLKLQESVEQENALQRLSENNRYNTSLKLIANC